MKTSKNRKKNQKRKDQQKCAPEMYKKVGPFMFPSLIFKWNEGQQYLSFCFVTFWQESNAFSSLCHNAKFGHELQSSLSETLKLQDVADVIFAPTAGLEDVDIDDEIDPALKEEIDR